MCLYIGMGIYVFTYIYTYICVCVCVYVYIYIYIYIYIYMCVHAYEKVPPPHDIMLKVLDCGLEVSKFQLQSSYYFHFQTNIFEKVIDLLIHPTVD